MSDDIIVHVPIRLSNKIGDNTYYKTIIFLSKMGYSHDEIINVLCKDMSNEDVKLWFEQNVPKILHELTIKKLKEIANSKSRKHSKMPKTQIYDRLGTISVSDVFCALDTTGPLKITVCGQEIEINRSARYQLFKDKGTKCVKCGLNGEFFAAEKHSCDKKYHLNLYALKDGNEVMMTKDHIIPRSKGGKDFHENYQPMCFYCNVEKGDSLHI